MKTIAFYNFKGGVGSTTLAGHTCFHAAERGIHVVGASLGHTHDLQRWTMRASLPWHDALEGLPTTCDLLVLDVHSHASCVDVLKPDLWVMPMCNRTAYENAERIMPSLSGPALWVWSRGNVWRDEVPAHLRAQVSMASVAIPNSRAIAETAETCSPAWATRLGARSPGAHALQALIADLLARVDMPTPTAPRRKGSPTAGRTRGRGDREHAA
jgi:hypothetical protein